MCIDYYWSDYYQYNIYQYKFYEFTDSSVCLIDLKFLLHRVFSSSSTWLLGLFVAISGLMIYLLICPTHNCIHTYTLLHLHTRTHTFTHAYIDLYICLFMITLHLLLFFTYFVACVLLYQCQVNHTKKKKEKVLSSTVDNNNSNI